MGEKKPNPIVIDGTEYDANDFTEEQQVLLQHCIDLERKINNTNFQLQQLQVGKESFVKMLKDALDSEASRIP